MNPGWIPPYRLPNKNLWNKPGPGKVPLVAPGNRPGQDRRKAEKGAGVPAPTFEEYRGKNGSVNLLTLENTLVAVLDWSVELPEGYPEKGTPRVTVTLVKEVGGSAVTAVSQSSRLYDQLGKVSLPLVGTVAKFGKGAVFAPYQSKDQEAADALFDSLTVADGSAEGEEGSTEKPARSRAK